MIIRYGSEQLHTTTKHTKNEQISVCKQVRLVNVCQRFVIGLDISEV